MMTDGPSQSSGSDLVGGEWCRATLGALGLLFGALLGGPIASSEGAPLSAGEVLIGQDDFEHTTGKVRQTQPDGTLVQVLDTTTIGGEQTGMCLDGAGNLYTTNFLAYSISKFSPDGTLLSAVLIDVTPSTPNSCAFDATGHLYVGLSDADAVNLPGGGGGGLLKFDVSGPSPALLEMFTPAPEGRGTDWIDLAPDQCTLLYTSVGSSIKRFDVCADAQLTDFCTQCDDGAGGPTGPFLAFRILLGGGGVLVADSGAQTQGAVRRYDGDVISGTGTHVRIYTGEDLLGTCGPAGNAPCFFPFALNLDPDGSSFWSADYATSEVFHFAIDGSGSPLESPFCGAAACDLFHFVSGLAIVGEPTAATAVNGTKPSASVTPAPASKTYGAPDPVLTGTLAGFLPADGVTPTYSRTPGETVAGSPYTISATLSPAGVLGKYNITYNTASFTITKADPTVVATGNTCVYSASPCTGSGSATGVLNESLMPVTLTYKDAQNTVLPSPPVAAGTYTVVAVYPGDGNYNQKQSAPETITITKAPASVTPNTASKAYGTADPAFTGTLAGFLAADNVTATYSRTAGESVAGSPYTISATLSPAGVLGNYTIAYNTADFIIYGKSEGGSFVIGDGNATVGNAVDFWGAQWWKDNTLGGGVNPGVASLKGFLDGVSLPGNCGGSWSTRPGNSSKPPSSIPAYMAVIVSSSISKHGSTIGGDVVAEVIVKTDSGYGPNPGHGGTGTIVGTICRK